MPASKRSRLLFALLAAALVAGGVGWWYAATSRAEYLLRRGRAALERGDRAGVEQCVARLRRRGEADAVHLLVGEIWLAQARALLAQAPADSNTRDAFRQALREFAQVRGGDPLAADATVRAAECLVRLNEHGLAAEGLAALARRLPDHQDAHRWLAAIYIDLNSRDQAVAQLREWARLDPEDGRPYRWIGFFDKDYDRPEEAVEAYRETLRRRLEPRTRADVCKELAETLIANNADYPAALAALDQCPEEFRRLPELLTLRAECEWNLGRHAGAVALVEAALKADPELPAALYLRGKMYQDEDQFPASVAPLEKAVRLDPHDHRSRQLLMLAYRQRGDTQRAAEQQKLLEQTLAYREKVTELSKEAVARPWDDQVRCRLGSYCLKLNRVREARMWFHAALACNPQSPMAREELARLEGKESGSRE